MPRLTVRITKYRLHKPSGRAVVTIHGRDHYLGTHGSAESKAWYNQLIGEWKLTGHGAPTIRRQGLTVDEVIVAYMDHVRAYYVQDGRPTSSQVEARRFLAPLHEQFGSLPSPDFGPLCLKALQQDLVKRRNWCRTTVNKAIGYIKRMFKWAAGN